MKRRYKDTCICNQPAPRPACKAHNSNKMWLKATKRHKRKQKARARIMTATEVLARQKQGCKVSAKDRRRYDKAISDCWTPMIDKTVEILTRTPADQLDKISPETERMLKRLRSMKLPDPVRRLHLRKERRGRRSAFEIALTKLLNDYMRQPSVVKALETQFLDQAIYGVSRVKLPFVAHKPC